MLKTLLTTATCLALLSAVPLDALAQARGGSETGMRATIQNRPVVEAKKIQAPDFSTAQQARITEAEAYLQNIKTLVADYVQIAPNGGLTSGKMYLMRPGKMRWQYDPPTPILMIANGKFLTFIDYELNQINHIPLDQTLAGFLARDDIEFGKDVVVTGLDETPGSMRVTLVQRARPTDGELVLEFALSPMQLRNIVIKDAVGQETTVSLNNAQFGTKLDESLFKFEDPRIMPNIGSRERGIQR